MSKDRAEPLSSPERKLLRLVRLLETDWDGREV